jgi:Domain of unknown function (DUF4864)
MSMQWIRATVLVGALAALSSVRLVAQADSDDWRVSTKSIREGVLGTVEAQLRAIREKDFARAYSYAAVEIKQRFTLPVFTAMLRRGYPALLRHKESEPGGVRDDGEGHAVVVVTVIDQLDQRTNYRYFLLREDDTWRIEGVVPEGKPPKADT